MPTSSLPSAATSVYPAPKVQFVNYSNQKVEEVDDSIAEVTFDDRRMCMTNE